MRHRDILRSRHWTLSRFRLVPGDGNLMVAEIRQPSMSKDATECGLQRGGSCGNTTVATACHISRKSLPHVTIRCSDSLTMTRKETEGV